MRYRPLLDFLRRVYALLSSTGEAETHDQELDCFGSRATCMSFHRLALSSRIISLFYAVLVEVHRQSHLLGWHGATTNIYMSWAGTGDSLVSTTRGIRSERGDMIYGGRGR